MQELGAIWLDFRYAMRSLRKGRVSVALALVALALGIGATTVIFSVVYSVVIHPYPYRDPDRLLQIYVHDTKQSGEYGRFYMTVDEFLDYKEQNNVFSNFMGGNIVDVVYTLNNVTYQARAAFDTPDLFADFGMKPILGREITEADGRPDAPPVFVMSDKMWHERFNRDPRILGTTLTVNGIPRTLIGIMPPRFLLQISDIWYPMNIERGMNGSLVGGPAAQPLYVWVVGRLKPGVSIEEADADLNVIAQREAKKYPALYPKQFKMFAGTLTTYYTRSARTMIYVLLAAVLMLLLIACSNVANLLLARAIAREKELAVRATLGASQGRLIRQLLVESFVLAAAGTAIGCCLAYGGLQLVKTIAPPSSVIPAEAEIRMSSVALFTTIGITLLTSLLCGLAPALRAARGDLHGRLMGTGKGVGASAGHGTFRNVLVAAQVGLSIVLLVGAGLMMRTFFALGQVDLGFNPKNVLVARVVFSNGNYTTPVQKQVFFREILPRISTIPGVIAVSESVRPPADGGITTQVNIPGSAHSDTWTSEMELVSEGYFQTIGLPLLRGNLLSATDVDSGRRVAVINRKLAHDFFGDEDPIGRTIKFNVLDTLADAPHDASFEIVGIVGDARNLSLQQPPSPEVFIPYTITGLASRTILVRTAVDPLSELANVRQEVANVDHSVALSDTGSLESILHRDFMAAPEFGLALLAVFAAIGLILSAIGVFSVMSYSVSLQTHDIGIRMALGAQPRVVMNMVLLKGLQPILAGVVVGLVSSFGLTRLMASQIYGVSTTDPWTFAAVILTLTVVGMLACLLPARRATRVDPLVALRHE